MDFKLGDFVRSRKSGVQGRIFRKYHFFKETSQTMEWFASQAGGYPLSTLEEPWCEILCHNEGVLLLPVGDLEPSQLSAGEFINRNNSFYFRD
jgi:hypothetical protein